MFRKHQQLFQLAHRLVDLAITAGVWIVCFYIRFHSGWMAAEGPIPQLELISDILIISLLLTAIVFDWMGLYRPRRTQGILREVFDVAKAAVLVWVVEVVFAHFLHSNPVSRRLQGMILIAWPTTLIVYRLILRGLLRFFRRKGRNLRSAAVVGTGRSAQKIYHALNRQPWTGYRIQYFIGDHRQGHRLLGLPVRGPLDEAQRIIRQHPVDGVFVALSKSQIHRAEDILGQLAPLLIDLHVVPPTLGHLLLQRRIHQIGQTPVIHLTNHPQRGVPAICKRLIDLLVSILLLLALSPLLGLIALLVKLSSPGPVFYSQRRASIGGREFHILKFRSMLAGPAEDNSWSTDPHDPRITRVGRLLRKLSLDELPQLFNVLAGQMSLVGPRPEQPDFVERFQRQFPRYMLRHHVKAGITGWAQIHGFRGRTSLRKRLQYDLDYIQRWSLLLDLQIILLTPFRGLINPAE
ncbi:MAG: undecaprenyl-phosphate glucose phosphotransferase [Phycisphaerae bacterium]